MAKMKNILISHIGIPSDKIGSWNVLFTNLIKEDTSIFTDIISPKPIKEIADIKHTIVSEPSFAKHKIGKIITFYQQRVYWKALKKIITKNTTSVSVVNIIDNIGVLLAVDFYSKQEGLRNRLHINFYLHGFNFENHANKVKIYESIDTLILLTRSSYINQLNNNHTIPCEVKLLRNGIDSTVFYPVTSQEKSVLRNQMGFNDEKIYFLWISQDRPKKGLKIILKAWKELTKTNPNIELIVIGTHQEVKEDQVVWFERMENTKLAFYYQITDYYLFSTLCHEGHPLSLTEALKCGAKCLASNIDPISEVLQDGNLGVLVDFPNFVSSWVDSMNYVLHNDVDFNKEKLDLSKLYDFDEWTNNIKNIFNE